MKPKYTLLLVTCCLLLSASLGGHYPKSHRNYWPYRPFKWPPVEPRPLLGAEVVHEWLHLEYDWPCDYVQEFYADKGLYDPKTNILGGIDVYNDDLYVTVYRMAHSVPSGLHKVVRKNGKSLLQAFPSLKLNELGKCSNLQYPISTVTDPTSGYMYVLDVGTVQGPFESAAQEASELCPPKIVVLDLKRKGVVVRTHSFPEDVVPKATNLLNDLVLDRVTRDGSKVRYAYMTDVGNEQLVVFDFETNSTWAFQHESMKVGEDNVVNINGMNYSTNIGVDGIALTADFQFVYYCAISSLELSQIPTWLLRSPSGNFAAHHRYVGNKVSQSDALVYGQKSLFFGAESLNAVYKWETSKDIEEQGTNEGQVNMTTQTEIVRDDSRYQWVDSLKLDTKGYLWFTSNRIFRVIAENATGHDFSGSGGNNFRIARVFVGEKSYLSK